MTNISKYDMVKINDTSARNELFNTTMEHPQNNDSAERKKEFAE